MSNVELVKDSKGQPSLGLNFLLLVSGRMVSDLGSSVFRFALSLYVLDITGSAGAFSMILGFSILPGVLINILVGTFVDRHKEHKKLIIVLSDVLSGVVVLSFMALFGFYSKSMLLFIFYVVVLSALQSFFTLSLNSSIQNIVSKEHTARANSAFQSVGAVINIAGPIIGAIAYRTVSMNTLFFIDGLTFIAAGLFEIFLKFSKSEGPEGEGALQENEVKTNYLEQVKDVFKYLNEEKHIQIMIYLVIAINFFYNPLMMLVLPFATYNQIKVSPLQLSLVQAAWSVGMIMGAVYVSTRKSSTGLLKKTFTMVQVQGGLIILWILSLLPVFTNESKWTVTILFGVLMIITGVFNTVSNVPILTCLQLQVPEGIRARVFGVIHTGAMISTPLGMWVYGVLLDKINWVYISTLAGIFIGLFSLIGRRSVILKRFFANLE